MRAAAGERRLPAARPRGHLGARRRRSALFRSRRGQPGRVRGRTARGRRERLPLDRRAHRFAEPAPAPAPRRERARLSPARRRDLRRRPAAHLARPRSVARRASGAAQPRRSAHACWSISSGRCCGFPTSRSTCSARSPPRACASIRRRTSFRCSASTERRRCRSCSRRSCARAASRARAEDVLSFDLMAYDTQPAVVAGARGEFVQASRLDNLASCHAATSALVRAVRAGPVAATRGIAFFDHEEVGSRSASGALGPLLAETLERIADWREGSGPRRAAARARAQPARVGRHGARGAPELSRQTRRRPSPADRRRAR